MLVQLNYSEHNDWLKGTFMANTNNDTESKVMKEDRGTLKDDQGNQVDRHENIMNIALIDDEMTQLLIMLNITTLDDIIKTGAVNIYTKMKEKLDYYPSIEILYLLGNIERRGVISTFIEREHREQLTLEALK